MKKKTLRYFFAKVANHYVHCSGSRIGACDHGCIDADSYVNADLNWPLNLNWKLKFLEGSKPLAFVSPSESTVLHVTESVSDCCDGAWDKSHECRRCSTRDNKLTRCWLMLLASQFFCVVVVLGVTQRENCDTLSTCQSQVQPDDVCGRPRDATEGGGSVLRRDWRVMLEWKIRKTRAILCRRFWSYVYCMSVVSYRAAQKSNTLSRIIIKS